MSLFRAFVGSERPRGLKPWALPTSCLSVSRRVGNKPGYRGHLVPSMSPRSGYLVPLTSPHRGHLVQLTSPRRGRRLISPRCSPPQADGTWGPIVPHRVSPRRGRRNNALDSVCPEPDSSLCHPLAGVWNWVGPPWSPGFGRLRRPAPGATVTPPLRGFSRDTHPHRAGPNSDVL